MRTLFHDTVSRKTGKPLSQPLLSQLSMLDCTVLTTPRTKLADWKDFLAVKTDLPSSSPTTFAPRLDLALIEIPLKTWWE